MDVDGHATGNSVKRRRAVPPGLTKQEEKVLKKVTRRAHRLDTCIKLCGIRIGWEAVVGIVPGLGDVFGAFMALMVVWTCTHAEIPPALKSRMLLNVAFDFAIGLVPFLGDVADAFFRCNTRNAALLYKHLQERGSQRLKHGSAGQTDDSRSGRGQSRDRRGQLQQQHREPSQKSQRLANAAAAAPENASNAVVTSEKSPAAQPPPAQTTATTVGIQKPQPVKTQEGSGRGWMSRFGTSSKQPPRDLENGDLEMVQR